MQKDLKGVGEGGGTRIKERRKRGPDAVLVRRKERRNKVKGSSTCAAVFSSKGSLISTSTNLLLAL